ncbi:SDR family NAD(P)-dependent oxidoreductase [Streptomyces sp. NPDC050147]|uniref:SDR family NAD(P)-dependent oxidoreductase n=1 Tax=Streptomyces sp. NPDC050147 TaxID=3155513 RepID=UPI0034293A2D
MPLTAYDLSGRTAFVTGAASGIGRASAVLLAEAGATVHCADRDTQGLQETATLIKAAGGTAHTHTVDVADRAQVEQAVVTATESTGRLDVMAAIAGIMHSSPVLETRDEDLDRVLNINFKGVLYACQAAARAMIAANTPNTVNTANTTTPANTANAANAASANKTDGPRHPGSIITMASGAVDTGGPGLLCYGAAKAAVVQLTKTLATEVGPHGIRVNAVAPGWIRTPMTDRHGADAQAHTEALMARMSPLGRVGEPEDIAHAVLHLASDASAFTTGQILRPNGGVAMPW